MNKVYNGFSKSSGIYQIINKINGHFYFGQAAQLATRAMQHEYSLNKNKHDNKHLQRAWNLYGSDAFEFTVLAVYPDRSERDAAEQALITEFYGETCYNMMKTVLPAPGTWSHTPEETRAKISAARKGKPHTPEHRAKLSAAKTGKKRSPRSPEHCAALSVVNTGKKLKPEHIAKMIAAKKAKPKSEKTIAKIAAAANRSKTYSAEHRAAMSAGWVKRRAAKALLASTVLPLDSDLS